MCTVQSNKRRFLRILVDVYCSAIILFYFCLNLGSNNGDSSIATPNPSLSSIEIEALLREKVRGRGDDIVRVGTIC